MIEALTWISAIVAVFGILLIVGAGDNWIKSKKGVRLVIMGTSLFVAGLLATSVCVSYLPKPPPAKAGASLFDKICSFDSY